MPKAVITGGAGFLGSHLCDRLLSEGYEVICVDNFITGSQENLKHLEGDAGLALLEHDVTKYLDVPGHVDAVLHFASPASPADYTKYPIQTLKVGALGTHVTLGLAKAKTARYLLASSSEVYGDPDVNPQPEDCWGNVNPIGPRGVYDEAKRYAEAMTMAYHQVHGLDTHIARIFNSVVSTEPVVLMNDQQLHIEPIGQYFESKDPDAVVEVPCFDPSDQIVKTRISSDLIRVHFEGAVYTVRTTYGREVTVTGDHSLFTHDEDMRPVPIPVRELRLGMRVAIPARLDIEPADVEFIDFAEGLIQELPEEELWEYAISDASLCDQITARRREVYDLFRKRSRAREPRSSWGSVSRLKRTGKVPLAVVKAFGLSWSREARICAYRGTNVTLPNEVMLTDDLLWLLGFYLAEGAQAKIEKKVSTLQFSSETHFLVRAQKILESAFEVHIGEVPSSEARGAQVYVHSKPLHALVIRILGFGEKRIPPWVLQLPLVRVKHFLEGYKDGDGTHSGESVGKLLDFTTVSEGLATDLSYLLLRFGIIASIGRYDTRFRQKYGDRKFPFYRISIRGLSDYDILNWDRGVGQKIQRMRGGDIIWAIVKRIGVSEYNGFVYDLSVPGAENFIAGSGIFCHNTYGPRMRLNDGRAIPNFIYQALSGKPLTIYGDGSQTRSFCYVSDMTEGLWRLLNSDVHDPVNLGNPEERTILELTEKVRDLVGDGATFAFRPLPQDDPKVRRPDITKARQLLDWKPTVGLEEGLRKTIAHFRRRIQGRRNLAAGEAGQ